MKYSFLGFGLIMIGLFGLVFIVMFETITINNESEYYVLREAMEAAMLESVDLACYRIGDANERVYIDTNNDGVLDGSPTGACGDNDIKIVEQKFVENFTRRFATSISGDVTAYTLVFYDIIEKPPKVTVVVKGKTKEYMLSQDVTDISFDIVNDLSGILELKRVV